MKYKYYLLIAFLIFSHISFAGNKDYDKIINAPNVYFELTGNATIDNMLQSIFADYWKINHVIAIPANTPKKEITISESKAPVFVFINSYSVKTAGYVDCLAILWGNAGTFTKGSFDPETFLTFAHLFVPSDKMNLLDIDFAIPLAIKEMNDKLMSYKENRQLKDNPSVISDKTLLIPQEIVDTKTVIGSILPAENLEAYKFKYKIMPTSEIRIIANDSSENSQYCYFTYDQNVIVIYDLETKDKLMSFTFKYVQFFKIKESEIEKLSDEIAGSPSTKQKK